MNHVHVGAINAMVLLAYLLILGFLLRTISAQYPDSAVGKAIAYIY